MKLKIKNRLLLSVVSIGITTFIAQIIILREFLTLFHGNELVIGIVMASWMLLIGFGAYLGRFFKKTKGTKAILWTQLLIAFLPFITVLCIRLSKYLLFPTGIELGLVEIVALSFSLMAPLCILSGYIFTAFCSAIIKIDIKDAISKVYLWETIGSILGGMLFNFIFILWLKPFDSLFLLILINLLAAFCLSLPEKLIIKLLPIVLLIFSTISFIEINFEQITSELTFQNQKIIENKYTPHGNLIVTETEKQLNFYENGKLLFSDSDVKSKEEDVHYAMMQCKEHEKVLLISGGTNGAIEEILKYNTSRIDYLEVNPELIRLTRRLTNKITNNPKLTISYTDPRIFLKATKSKYNAVIINVPEPNTAQINRFYTFEFFSKLKKRMADSSILSISLPSAANYMNKNETILHAILYHTLKETFQNVLILPAGKNYFLASDAKLNPNIDDLLHSLPTSNLYVNQYYIDPFSLNERREHLEQRISKVEPQINQDFKPIAYFYRLKSWINQQSERKLIYIIPLLLILVIIILKFNPINIGLFAGGFAGSSLEIVFILSFQIVHGYIYNIVGIIVLAFMVGLAIGVKSYKILFPSANFKSFISLQLILGLYALAIPLILMLVNKFMLSSWAIYFIFTALTLDIAILVGMEFGIASKLKQTSPLKHASSIYSSDMLGSAIGALLVSAFLIPLIGILYTCVLIGLLNLLSASIGYYKRSNYG